MKTEGQERIRKLTSKATEGINSRRREIIEGWGPQARQHALNPDILISVALSRETSMPYWSSELTDRGQKAVEEILREIRAAAGMPPREMQPGGKLSLLSYSNSNSVYERAPNRSPTKRNSEHPSYRRLPSPPLRNYSNNQRTLGQSEPNSNGYERPPNQQTGSNSGYGNNGNQNNRRR